MEQDNDFGLVIASAVRYALGRQTYITKVVTDFVINHLTELNAPTISIIERDIREANDYGDTVDKEWWLNLLKVLHNYMDENNIKKW